jgi:hypothetical protein
MRLVVPLMIAVAICSTSLTAQEYSVRAVDDATGKNLSDIPITLRYACKYSGSGLDIKVQCKFIQRKTGADGLAHFPEAMSIKDFDDIYSLPITYGMTCCDITKPEIPGIGVMRFRQRSFSEVMHWILLGD